MDYNSLVSTVIAYKVRENDTNFANLVPTFIELFETKMTRELRFAEQITSLTTTLPANTQTISVPQYSQQVTAVYITENGKTQPLQQVAFTSLLNFEYPQSKKPQYYAIEGNTITVFPVADQNYTITINYFNRIDPLTSSNTTNWLIENYPDLYLYGTLVEADIWGVALPDEAAPMKSAFLEAIVRAKQTNKQKMSSRQGTVPSFVGSAV